MTDLFEKCNGDGGYFGRFRAAGWRVSPAPETFEIQMVPKGFVFNAKQ